jgi:hypothetical protein
VSATRSGPVLDWTPAKGKGPDAFKVGTRKVKVWPTFQNGDENPTYSTLRKAFQDSLYVRCKGKEEEWYSESLKKEIKSFTAYSAEIVDQGSGATEKPTPLKAVLEQEQPVPPKAEKVAQEYFDKREQGESERQHKIETQWAVGQAAVAFGANTLEQLVIDARLLLAARDEILNSPSSSSASSEASAVPSGESAWPEAKDSAPSTPTRKRKTS